VADHSELAVRAANAVGHLSRRGWRIESSALGVSVDEVVALPLAVEAASRRVPDAAPTGWQVIRCGGDEVRALFEAEDPRAVADLQFRTISEPAPHPRSSLLVDDSA
jgi:hypothetical protein